MELTHIVVVLLLCLCLVIEASISTEDDYTDFKQLMKILSKPRMLDRYMYSNEVIIHLIKHNDRIFVTEAPHP